MQGEEVPSASLPAEGNVASPDEGIESPPILVSELNHFELNLSLSYWCRVRSLDHQRV